jgi:outer membrane lipoprotein-sorting protein
MFRKFFLSLACLTILGLPVCAQTVDEIVSKHIQAQGGLEKLKTVKTIRYSGKMQLGQGLEAPAVLEKKRPNSLRMEFTVQGLTGVQAYDGKTGWMLMPFGGKKDPEPMGEDELKAFTEEADFDGPLVDYKEKGNKVELVGKEPVEGTDAYKLKVTLKNGEVDYVYLDTDSYLVLKQESKRTVRGAERESEVNLGDYKEVEGLVIPFSFEMGQKGMPQKQKIIIEKVELNPAIEDTRFKMPEVKKVEPKPEEKKPEQTKPPEEKK